MDVVNINDRFNMMVFVVVKRFHSGKNSDLFFSFGNWIFTCLNAITGHLFRKRA